MAARRRKPGSLGDAVERMKQLRAEDAAAEEAKRTAAELRAEDDARDEEVKRIANATKAAELRAAEDAHAEELRRIREAHEASEDKDMLSLRERKKYYEEQRKHQKNRKPREKVTVYMEPELREEIRTIVLQMGFLGLGISQADWCAHALMREVERMRAIYNDGEPFVRFSGKLAPGNVRKRIPDDD